MHSNQNVFDLPTRASLAERTAAAIRKAIEQAVWEEYLPGERHLCEMFKVSRPTIHSALHMLAKDGWLDIRQGRCNRILSVKSRAAAPRNQLIGLVACEPLSHFMVTAYERIVEMRVHLAEHGFATAVLVCQPGDARAQRRKLEKFVRENGLFCCALLSVSKEVQQWFVERSIPTFVIGSCHDGVQLPSLDVDHASVCRHAAGVFLRKGHRQLALIVPDMSMAGDLVSEQSFQGAVKQSGHKDAHAVTVRHNGTGRNFTARLDALFSSAHAPTALLVSRPPHVLAVIFYLLKRGHSVPGTVSLIARDPDMLFKSFDPPISHYQFEGNAYMHRLCRLMLTLANQGHLPPKPHVIIPSFFEGGTVRRFSG